jgi:hypothetical protein
MALRIVAILRESEPQETVQTRVTGFKSAAKYNPLRLERTPKARWERVEKHPAECSLA